MDLYPANATTASRPGSQGQGYRAAIASSWAAIVLCLLLGGAYPAVVASILRGVLRVLPSWPRPARRAHVLQRGGHSFSAGNHIVGKQEQGQPWRLAGEVELTD